MLLSGVQEPGSKTKSENLSFLVCQTSLQSGDIEIQNGLRFIPYIYSPNLNLYRAHAVLCWASRVLETLYAKNDD